MASPKELKLESADGPIGATFALIPAAIAIAFGGLGVLGVLRATSTPQKISNGIFVVIGCVGLYIAWAVIATMFTNIHLRRSGNTLDVEWRRFGKLAKRVSSPVSALSLSLSEITNTKTGKPNWTVTLATSSEDVRLGGYAKRDDAEKRKALVAKFLELDADA